jgi:hypothetical protein
MRPVRRPQLEGRKADDEPREFAHALREQTKFLATRAIAEEHSLREHFEQLSSVLSVRESIRTQRRMEWLTVVALLVAMGSLWIALPPFEEWRVRMERHLRWLDTLKSAQSGQ